MNIINIKTGIFLAAIFGLINIVNAQNDPLLTHFVFNKQSYNPGVVGVKGSLDAGAIYRNQWWSGIEGAPKTLQVYANMPIQNDHAGLGVNIVSDKIGLTNTTAVDLSYAYRIKFSNSNLAFGIMPRFESASYNWDLSDPHERADANLNGKSKTSFNIGAGLYYNTDNFYAGLSMPRLLENSLYVEDNFTRKMNSFYFLTGYVFKVTDLVKFHPAALVSVNAHSPFEFELNGNFIFNDAFLAGLSYRYQDAVSVLFQYMFKNGLRAGAAIDLTASELNNQTTGSFEILVGYSLNCESCDIVNLRYF